MKIGTTAYFNLHGVESKVRLMPFGEQCLCKPRDTKAQVAGKGVIRWQKGIFVGINEVDESFIILTPQGVKTAREVSRLSPSNAWSRAALEAAAGLPWDKKAGALENSPVPPQLRSHVNVESLPVGQGPEAQEAVPVVPNAPPGTPFPPPQTPAPAAQVAPGTPFPPPQAGENRRVDFSAMPNPLSPMDVHAGVIPGGQVRNLITKRPVGQSEADFQGQRQKTTRRDPRDGLELSRTGHWEPRSDNSKKWRSTDRVGALIENANQFLEEEVQDRDYIGALMDVAELHPDWTRRGGFRREEIEKLKDFACFEVKWINEVPQGVRIFQHTWVDSESKSRLTMRDLRKYDSDPDEERHCPTPSSMSNAIFEWLAAHTGMDVTLIDVVSAFPHAPEKSEAVYLHPPTEWLEDNQLTRGQVVWRITQSLYGKRTASASYRLYFEALMVETPTACFTRGIREPCFYHCKSTQQTLLHHIDDKRLLATEEDRQKTIAHLSSFLLLKVSDPIRIGDSYKYLGRLKLRIDGGWITRPDKMLYTRACEIAGLEITDKMKVPPTPSVDRGVAPADTQYHTGTDTEYRSAVGSLIHLSQDVE